MTKRKYQRNKALYSKKKIWLVQVYLKERNKTDLELMREGKWNLVYVVDDSMGRAIKKAVHHFGRRTGIRYLKLGKYWNRSSLRISCRRACKIEIVNARAGMGLEGGVIKYPLEVI